MKYTQLFKFLLFLSVTACATAPFSGQEEYDKKIESYSAGDKQFSGLYHNFEFRATLLNEEIIRLVNERLTKVYAWDQVKSSEDLQTRLDGSRNSTRLFMSFFTPNIVDDNLTTSKSIWKVYLYSGGQRYEGKVSKANENLSEFQAIYPYHNRWATGYYVDFPVATESIQDGELKFVVTGPLGKREADFPPRTSL